MLRPMSLKPKGKCMIIIMQTYNIYEKEPCTVCGIMSTCESFGKIMFIWISKIFLLHLEWSSWLWKENI